MIEVGEKIKIKSTSLEPVAFHNFKGKVIRITTHGYLVIITNDNREVVLHPKSVKQVQS